MAYTLSSTSKEFLSKKNESRYAYAYGLLSGAISPSATIEELREMVKAINDELEQ